MGRAEKDTGDVTQQGQPAVALRNVVKSYERGTTCTRVLDSITLQVSHGESVFLLGPSGSGKTTLLSIIGCVLTPDAGEVVILGQNLARTNENTRAALRRTKIGFIFQRFHLIRGLSAVENVAVPLTLAGFRHVRALKRAGSLLGMVGLSEHADADPRSMSVGQCQRIAIARALAADPDLILADEPTASLDAATGTEAMQLLRNLTVESGKTMIVVTHDHRILGFADRIFHMENGGLQETPENADRHARLPPTDVPSGSASILNTHR